MDRLGQITSKRYLVQVPSSALHLKALKCDCFSVTPRDRCQLCCCQIFGMAWWASVVSPPAMDQSTRSLMPVRTHLCCAADACIVLCCVACAGASACDLMVCEPSTCIALVPLWLSPYFTFCAFIAHVLADSATQLHMHLMQSSQHLTQPICSCK